MREYAHCYFVKNGLQRAESAVSAKTALNGPVSRHQRKADKKDRFIKNSVMSVDSRCTILSLLRQAQMHYFCIYHGEKGRVLKRSVICPPHGATDSRPAASLNGRQ